MKNLEEIKKALQEPSPDSPYRLAFLFLQEEPDSLEEVIVISRPARSPIPQGLEGLNKRGEEFFSTRIIHVPRNEDERADLVGLADGPDILRLYLPLNHLGLNFNFKNISKRDGRVVIVHTSMVRREDLDTIAWLSSLEAEDCRIYLESCQEEHPRPFIIRPSMPPPSNEWHAWMAQSSKTARS